MARVRLMIELTYDKKLQYDENEEDLRWFFGDVLAREALVLHSSLLGDVVGEVRVLCCNRNSDNFDSREPRRCSEIRGILDCLDYFEQVEE